MLGFVDVLLVEFFENLSRIRPVGLNPRERKSGTFSSLCREAREHGQEHVDRL